MASLSDLAFDYAMQRGHGKKSHEHFYAGGKAVIQEIREAYEIGGFEAMDERINSFIEELKH